MNNFYLRFNREIWQERELSLEQKLILNFVWNFEVKAGYCHASDDYLSEVFGIPQYRILGILNELKDLNLIKSKEEESRRFLAVNKTKYSIQE